MAGFKRGMIGALAKKAAGKAGKAGGLGGAMRSVRRAGGGRSRAKKSGMSGAIASVTPVGASEGGTFGKMKARFQGRKSTGNEGGY